MSQAISEQTTNGYQPPQLVQFSVFLDNRVGKLLDLMDVFEDQALTLAGMSILDATDHAVVRLVTSNSVLARRLIGRHNLPFSEADVLAVELSSGKSITEMCRCLLQVEVNLQYAYQTIVRPRGLPVCILYTEDNTFSGQILRRRQFTLLAENDLGDNATGNTEDDQGAF